jgi:hypothetical protein
MIVTNVALFGIGLISIEMQPDSTDARSLNQTTTSFTPEIAASVQMLYRMWVDEFLATLSRGLLLPVQGGRF